MKKLSKTSFPKTCWLKTQTTLSTARADSSSAEHLADSGLTGRKIIVDTYGGVGSHGGGCFSGKDPSKVDRSGCYMARYIAKNIVAAGLADQCEIQISYAIGVAQPISVLVNTYETGKLPDSKILELVNKHFDMRPKAIIDQLNLLRPIYKKTAVLGTSEEKNQTFRGRKPIKSTFSKRNWETLKKRNPDAHFLPY